MTVEQLVLDAIHGHKLRKDEECKRRRVEKIIAWYKKSATSLDHINPNVQIQKQVRRMAKVLLIFSKGTSSCAKHEESGFLLSQITNTISRI